MVSSSSVAIAKGDLVYFDMLLDEDIVTFLAEIRELDIPDKGQAIVHILSTNDEEVGTIGSDSSPRELIVELHSCKKTYKQ